MRSRRDGGLSAITKVKVLSPEIFIIAQGQGFHVLEARIAVCARGECAAACRGLSPWQANQRFTSELGRAMSLPTGSLQQAGEARRRYGGMAVGLTRSRGVAGVMPGAGIASSPLEGVSSKA